jgi:uncharacterized membrane protein (UPF0127 family)
MRTFHLLSALLILLLAAGTARSAELATFNRGEVTITTSAGPHKFAIELATNEVQREQGLMFRLKLPADAGMLFVYPEDQPVAIWMKNTYIPLDILFIEANGRIKNIRERAVPQSLETMPSDGPLRAVLELNGGTVARLGIKPGDRVEGSGFGG